MRLFLLLFLTYITPCQGLQDSVLKATLTQAINGGERYAYGPNQYHSTNHPPEWVKGDLKAIGTWWWFPETDITEDGRIWDMYSNSKRWFTHERGESACSMNIEHCLPKSWWGWNSKDTVSEHIRAYSDLYNLNPSDARANMQKSNTPPGHVTKGDKFDNGSFRMDNKKSSLYNDICFEPAAEYRGDFARTYFYMVTAYANMPWGDSYSQYVTPAHYTFFNSNITQVLLDWHRADPVSDKEIHRASLITRYQGNHNPFIDYPELVEYIWGDKQGQSVDLNTLICTYDSTYQAPVFPRESSHLYDTIVNLPGLTKALINAVPGGYASEKIQSNGTRSITMGASTTDGYIQFDNLNLPEPGLLVFRASVYDSGTAMQLDITIDGVPAQTITQTVKQETRDEVTYSIPLPRYTQSVGIQSVGGSTAKRACIQELYILIYRDDTTQGLRMPALSPQCTKELRHGRMLIHRTDKSYDVTGRKL